MQTNKPDRSPWQYALLSLIIPGSGQYLQQQRERGVFLLLVILVLGGLIAYFGALALWAPLMALWLWQVRDAYQLAKGKQPGWGAALLLTALILYGLGIAVTEIRPTRLVTGFPSMLPYVRALTEPDLLEYPTTDIEGIAPIQIPCVEPLPPPDREPTEDPRVTINVACGQVGDVIEVSGEGFDPNFEGEIRWLNPIGDVQRTFLDGEMVTFETDSAGRFQVALEVPQAVPLTQRPPEGETQTHAVRAEQHIPYGSLQPTETLSLVLEKIGETIALAFISTVLGVVFAVPVSFLAARNLMGGNRLTLVIYYIVRTILNVVRSIETLMWAIIFAVWVGLGPFAGTLALWLHTVAALGKLYSEAIESIDPGPIEAVRATGAQGPQLVVYAVLPQILPTFTSFTLYRFDINVRLSTVIGLVSDAGLGFLVIQWVRLNQFSAMSTAILAIIIVVSVADFVSGWLRERIIKGEPLIASESPVLRRMVRVGLTLLFVLTFIWSWRVAEIELPELVAGAEDGLALARSLMVPEILERPTETREFSAPLPVPCGAAAPQPPADPQVQLSIPCGSPGDPLLITGTDLPPDQLVSIRWSLPDGAFLRIQSGCCTTDSAGTVQLDTTINPIMEVPEGETVSGRVAITYEEVVGGPQLSESFIRVVELSIVTLLMAFMATTLGSVFAIPLSFFAARNIMGGSRPGRVVYYLFRGFFNIFRSIEPLILVLICAAWVGAGPFAGVLALTLNNIPNLGKLFSESIEEINEGPLEAVRATGAGRLQTLIYAIVPQLVPPFLAFILYQWDINIRMSTVIGFVGGGGIGQQFRIWIGLNQYSAAATATWAIVIMVWSMDYLSAKARERLT
jgi:phosphonate transport system permease protein